MNYMQELLVNQLLNGADMQGLFDIAEKVLGNPVTFVDATWNEPFRSKGYPEDDIEDRMYRKQNITDEENQKDIEYINSMSMTGKPYILGWAYIRRKRLICGSIVNGKHIGGIRLPDVGNPLEDIDEELIITVSKVLGIAFILNGWTQNVYSDRQNAIWRLINNDKKTTFLENNHKLHRLFPYQEFYMLWYLLPELKGKHAPNKEILSLFSCLDNWWQVPSDGGFGVLIAGENIKKKLDCLHIAAKKAGILIGISDMFVKAVDLKKHLEESKNVYEYALSYGIDNGIVLFNDYKLYHLLWHVNKEDYIDNYIHNTLEEIQNYDNENGTQYYLTLKTFLLNNQNITQTAEKLYIHKNTVFYRLQRLKDIFKIDLQDTKELVTIYYSIILLDK